MNIFHLVSSLLSHVLYHQVKKNNIITSKGNLDYIYSEKGFTLKVEFIAVLNWLQ